MLARRLIRSAAAVAAPRCDGAGRAGGVGRNLSRGAASEAPTQAAAAASETSGVPQAYTASGMNRSFKEIEQVEDNVFRNSAPLWVPSFSHTVYGGQAMGQAMAAAGRTVSAGLVLHSAHAYFVRPATNDSPITYHVERVKDGTVFNTRNVSVKQNGKTILSVMTSFHKVEDGCLNYRLPPPHVPHHSDLPLLDLSKFYAERKHALSPREDTFVKGHVVDDVPIDLKPIDPEGFFLIRPVPRRTYWIKAREPLGDDVSTHQGVMLCASDFMVLTCGFSNKPAMYFDPADKVLATSLDHAMWYHRPARADDWLLLDAVEESSAGNRTSTTGHIWTSDGVLVVSFAQEALIRSTKNT